MQLSIVWIAPARFKNMNAEFGVIFSIEIVEKSLKKNKEKNIINQSM